MNAITYNINARGIANIVLNKPDFQNVLDEEFIMEITEVFEKLGQDDTVRVIVLSGNGKNFCAGADPEWIRRMKSASHEDSLQDARNLAKMFKTANEVQKPLIGVVQGSAIGVGVGLVSVCDYVIAAANCQFALSEVRLGLAPATIAPYIVRKIGESQAQALFLSAEAFSSARAFQINLIHDVVPPAEINYRLQEVVVTFLKAGSEASKYTKKLIADLQHPDIVEYTAQLIAYLRASPEGQEGMEAYLEKRMPFWRAE